MGEGGDVAHPSGAKFAGEEGGGFRGQDEKNTLEGRESIDKRSGDRLLSSSWSPC